MAVVIGEWGCHRGESDCLPPVWPGFHSGPASHAGYVCCWFSPCSEGFSPGSPVFLPPQKPTSPNSNSTRIEDPHQNKLGVMWIPRAIHKIRELKDVRAHCYCASLVLTLLIGHARATSFLSARSESKTQQNIELMTFALIW